MSLTTCISKAGKLLRAEDKAALLDRSRALRAEGFETDAAGRKAIGERLTAVQGAIDELLRPTPTPAQAAAPGAATAVGIENEIKAVLSPDLLRKEYIEANKTNATLGHCYAAAEAAYHLLGGAQSGYVPVSGKDPNGVTHWWLRHRETGEILDPTREQYTSVGQQPPYTAGTARGFLTKEPSARARTIISRVNERRGSGSTSLNQAAGPVWYSDLERSLGELTTKSAPAAGWKQAIAGLVKAGRVKAAEVELSGVNEWLDLQQGKVPKEAVLDFLRGNGVRLEEVVLAEDEEGGTKFGSYQLHGGTNYREVLLTLPATKTREETTRLGGGGQAELHVFWRPGATGFMGQPRRDGFEGRYQDTATAERAAATYRASPDVVRVEVTTPAAVDVVEDVPLYTSAHWDQPNVLAHIRLNDRTDADGRRILFVEEVQSDWGQEGRRKGFTQPTLTSEQRATKMAQAKALTAASRRRADADRAAGLEQISDETLALNKADSIKAGEIMRELDADKAQWLDNAGRTPTAPFVTKTDAWLSLALKRIIKMAVDEGYDRVALINGQQSIDRYWSHPVIEGAVGRWNEVTKPESIGELGKNVLGKKLSALVPLDVVDGGMLTVLKHDQVRKDVVSRIPVDVVDMLSANGVKPEQLLRNGDVVLDRLSVDDRSRAATAIGAAIRESSAAIRAKLGGLEAGGRDVELLPALKASDLGPREIAGLLDPVRLFHSGAGSGPQSAAATGSTAEPLSGSEGRKGANEQRAAELASLLNAHAEIIYGRNGLLQQGFEAPPSEGMKAFYDQIVPSVAKDVLRKLGGGALETVGVAREPVGAGYHTDMIGGKYAVFKDGAGDNPINDERYATPEEAKVAFPAMEQPGFTITPAMREAAAAGLPMFQGDRGAPPRAQIHLPPGGISTGQSIISLLEGANWSSFLHESGHFFLEVQADLAARIQLAINNGESVSAGERGIVDDMEKLLTWFGVTGDEGLTPLDTWTLMSIDQRRAHHEKFAVGWEKFLMEGKAPSLELQSMFSKFRSWLFSVYKKLTNLNVELTDEVREVMGRMMASDIAIEEAEAARSMFPMVMTLEDAQKLGWSTEDFAAYQKLGEQATDDAVAKLSARAIADVQWMRRSKAKVLKDLQADVRAIYDEVRMEVRAALYQEDVYRAWQFLAERSGPDDNAAVAADAMSSVNADSEAPITAVRGKLNTEALREIYGNGEDAPWRRLSALRMTSSEGMDPDMVAARFNFDSADALVQALIAAVPPREAIEARTEARVLAEYGDITSPEALQAAADLAIHNDLRARVLEGEAQALAKAMKIPGPRGAGNLIVKAARAYAEQWIGKVKVRDLRPAQYTAAEGRNGKLAQKAFEAAKLEEAAMHKRNQIANHELARAALRAKDEVEKARRYFRKFDKRSKTLDPDYQDQIEQLLEQYEFRPTTQREDTRRRSLAAWLAEQAEEGVSPNIDPSLVEAAGRRSYKDMTVDELRSLVDAVTQIEHLGRLKNRLLRAKDQRELKAIVAEMGASIRAHGGEERPVQYEPEGRVRRWAEGFLAVHRKLASLFRQMDGNDDNGIMYRLIGQGMNEQSVVEEVMNERATQALREIFAPLLTLPGGMKGRASKLHVTEIGASLTRSARMAVALNWGNVDNRQRLLGDYEGGNHWTEAQALAIMRTLSPTELQAVNAIWAHLDSYWPEIAAKQKRVTGVEPEKVEAAPFSVIASDGTVVQMTGGYYPLKYDPARSVKADVQSQEQIAAEMRRGAVTAATTRRGHTIERQKEVKRPVLLDVDVVAQHVAQVTHDLAWHEWFIDTNRLLRHPEAAGAIMTHYGQSVLDTIRQDISALAVGDARAQDAVSKIGLHFRGNVSRATMGLSATTALMQPFGLTQSMVRIGAKHVLRGAARWVGDAAHFENTLAWINEQSDMMRLRNTTFNRELRELRAAVGGKSRIMEVVDAGLFIAMRKMQLVADVPTWLGQYQKSQDEGLSHEDSVAQADRAVLESQGGGQIKDLSQVQRDHPFLTQFFSYFNVTANLVAEQTAATDFKDPRAVAGWVSDMALLMVIPAVLPSLLLFALKGGSGDDEDKSIAWRIAKWQLSYLLGLAVYVREFGGAVEGFDYAGPPAGRIVADSIKAVKQTAQGELDEAAVLAYVNLLGSGLGIPTVQITRSYKGWKAWSEGQEGAGPASILFGPPPK